MKIPALSQIVGIAYNYLPSKQMRRRLTAGIDSHHSSQEKDFSYFYKGSEVSMSRHQEPLKIRKHPFTNDEMDHWPEAEVAILMGENHEIAAYALANDFTAIGIEKQGRSEEFDGTYFGKFWNGSCSLGPRWVPAREIDDSDLEVTLKIERATRIPYEASFNTSKRKTGFEELPGKIAEYHDSFQGNLPPSKRIDIVNGKLPNGTIILTGTYLIVPERWYSQEGDLITISSEQLGTLQNEVAQ
jgi:2-keto-4-pentenoate hydratase/2-oxohepta-3-ene-1,7-dioic acid hydratase in catechol pathway